MMVEESSNGQLNYNCPAGVCGSFGKDLKMTQPLDRTPLGVIDENSKKAISCQSTHYKNYSSSSSCKSILSSLKCYETIQLSPTFDPDRYEHTSPRKIMLKGYKETLIKFWLANFDCYFQTLAAEIFENLAQAQGKNHNLINYLTDNNEINCHARALLVEWMTDVTHDFILMPDTLFVAVNYLDRFLGSHNIPISGLQLLGMSCLIVSSKLNDKVTPNLSEFAYLMEDMYSKKEIINVEKEISCGLSFSYVVPTVLQFAEIYMVYFKNEFVTTENILFLQAICEFLLTDYDTMNSYYPSIIAAAGMLFVSNYVNGSINESDFDVFFLDASSLSACFQKVYSILCSLNLCELHNSKERLATLWPPYCSNDECSVCIKPRFIESE